MENNNNNNNISNIDLEIDDLALWLEINHFVIVHAFKS